MFLVLLPLDALVPKNATKEKGHRMFHQKNIGYSHARCIGLVVTQVQVSLGCVSWLYMHMVMRQVQNRQSLLAQRLCSTVAALQELWFTGCWIVLLVFFSVKHIGTFNPLIDQGGGTLLIKSFYSFVVRLVGKKLFVCVLQQWYCVIIRHLDIAVRRCKISISSCMINQCLFLPYCYLAKIIGGKPNLSLIWKCTYMSTTHFLCVQIFFLLLRRLQSIQCKYLRLRKYQCQMGPVMANLRSHI